MIDKICEILINRIRKKMPEIDDEKAEVILYGLQLMIGEGPKLFLMLAVAAILKVFWETLLAFILIIPYKGVSGGFHLKTHIGCFIGTLLFYCGNALLSLNLTLPINIKIIFIILNILIGIIMIIKYAPADTVNVPILEKKERITKKILSIIILLINMIIAFFIQNTFISNVLIFGTLLQTFSITRLAYWLTKNEYGYEIYMEEKNVQF